MQVRDTPNRMTSNLEKQIIELSKLMSSDRRIGTPSNGSIDNVRHDLIKGRDLGVRIDWLPYQRLKKLKETLRIKIGVS